MREISNWRSEKVPHNYNDGTTHTWEVHADGFDGAGRKMDILLGNWLTEDSARLIAAAPDMLAALKSVAKWLLDTEAVKDDGFWNKDFVKANNLTLAAIAKAEGRT